MSDNVFEKKLAESGLDLSDANQLGIELLTPAQTLEYAPQAPNIPSMLIKYYDPKGQLYSLDSGRIRLLGKLKGFLGAAKKPPRFYQKKGAKPLPYFPQHESIDWHFVLANTENTIYFTEGELKACCLAKHGLPCIGLGGVYNWRSKRLKMLLIPEIAELNLMHREIILAFDSDTATNMQVQSALSHFADILTSKCGANVKILELPQVGDNQKTGVDDYIVAHGIDKFKKLLHKLVDSGHYKALENFNRKVLFIRSTCEFMDIKNLQVLKKTGAADAFANEEITVSSKKGLTDKPILPIWLRWKGRSEVNKVIFDPALEPGEITNEYINTWKGFPHSPHKGDVSLWDYLLDHLITDDSQRTWVKNWIAWRFQNPGIKPNTSLVLWSREQGTGKSTLCNILCQVLGEDYSQVITPELLMSQFNGWMAKKLLVIVEEVYEFERRQYVNKLKSYITQNQMLVNEKHIAEYNLKDVAGFIFTSNNSNAVYFDEMDRRYSIIKTTADILEHTLGAKINGWACSTEGQSALMHHFLNYDTNGFDATAPAPMSADKEAMLYINQSPFDTWLLELGDDGINGCKLASSTQIQSYYMATTGETQEISTNKIGRKMSKYGFRQANNGKYVNTGEHARKYWCLDRHEHSLLALDHAGVIKYLDKHNALEDRF
jgi:hypothetical protein